MKLISNFHDYYDSVQAYAHDPKILFIRRESEVFYDDLAREQQHLIWYNIFPNIEYISRGCILFCGKSYPFYEYDSKCSYSLDSLRTNIIFYLNKQENYSSSLWTKENILKKIDSEYIQKQYKYITSNFKLNVKDEIFRNFNSPILCIRYTDHCKVKIIINPRLSKYNFQSQMDPYQVYQEIEMYLGNNLVDQKDPNPKISDELRRDSAGFNEWSFKTHKTESKKYRKKNK